MQLPAGKVSKSMIENFSINLFEQNFINENMQLPGIICFVITC